MRPAGTGLNLRPGVRDQSSSPPPQSNAAVTTGAPLRGKKRHGTHDKISKAKRNLILIAFLAFAMVSLIGATVYVAILTDDGDDPKGSTAFSLDDWKVVLEKKAKQSAPPHESLGLSQVVFVSCNRHDRSQAYWGYIAAASQCEMVPTDVRAKSAPCRRLYAGRSPMITTVGHKNDGKTMPSPGSPEAILRDVPVGACGSVVDSRIAQEYRAAAKSDFWKETMQLAKRALRRSQRFYPASSVGAVAPPPLDALVWLGDAIYADKKADGKRSQSFGHVVNSLEDVKQMWIAQRDAPIYDAFRGSCLRHEQAATQGQLHAAEVGANGDDDIFDLRIPGAGFFDMVADTVNAWFGEDDGDTAKPAAPGAAKEDTEGDRNVVLAPVDEKDDPDDDGGVNGDTPHLNPDEEEGDEAAAQARGEHDEKGGDGEDQGLNLADDGNNKAVTDGAVGAIVNELINVFVGDEDDEEVTESHRPEKFYPDGMDGYHDDAADAALHNHVGVTRESAPGGASMPPQITGKRRPSVYGTWDDHDMGENDGGKEYPHKNVTQEYLLDFLQAPKDDVRWQRPGVYTFHTLAFSQVFMGDSVSSAAAFGGEAKDNDRLALMQSTITEALKESYVNAVCLILLDVRSFRDRPDATGRGDMLGTAQWQWLEKIIVEELAMTDDGREKCALTLVGSGIQLIADEKTAENWAAFPNSRDRLFGLFKLHRVERVAFLTGDVHMGELAADFTPRTINYVMGYPIIEATSSGLTHSAAVAPGVATVLRAMFPSPKRRIGRLYVERNFGTARLSLNGALAMSQLESILQTLRGIPAPAAPYPQAALAVRRRVRDTLNTMVNVTFTVFSIPKRGKPVLRLNFPLNMLTYEGAQRYLDARVVPQRGYVYMSLPSGPVRDVGGAAKGPASSAIAGLPDEDLSRIKTFYPEGLRKVAHYPNNEAPLFTGYIRFMQRHFFFTLSVSETIGRLIKLHAIAGVLALVFGTFCFFQRAHRHIRRGIASGAGGYSSSAAVCPGGTAPGKEESVAVTFSHYILGKEDKRKEG